MRASDATGRTATKRSERRYIVALGMLERRRERNKENVEGEGKEREGGARLPCRDPTSLYKSEERGHRRP